MKKIVFKKGFFKKPKIELPEEFVEKCISLADSSKQKVAYISVSATEVILKATDKESDIVFLELEKYGKEIPYKEVVGFFEFRGNVFYRSKGSAGKEVKSNTAFTDFIKNKYESEFENVKVADVSKLSVQPLNVK